MAWRRRAGGLHPLWISGSFFLLLFVTARAVGSEPTVRPAGDPAFSLASAQDASLKNQAAAGVAPPRTSDAKPTEGPTAPAYDIFTTKRLTGDWFGLRSNMEDMGITILPIFTAAYGQNFRGGLNTHDAYDFGGKWFYNFLIDFEKMGVLDGASIFFRAIQTFNDGVRGDVGSLSTPHFSIASSGDVYIGDEPCILVDKWWWRQRLFDDRVEFRLGKLFAPGDLFDSNKYAGNYVNQFFNSALYINTTVPIEKGLGAYLKVWPTKWVYLSGGVVDSDSISTRTGFDTAFDAPARATAYYEFGLLPEYLFEGALLPGTYRFGGWYDGRSKTIFKDTLNGALRTEQKNGDSGFYLSFDQMLWKENDDPGDTQGLGAFCRYGYADGDVKLIEHHWSVGAQYEGLIPTRDSDVLGFGVAQSILSKQYRREVDGRADRETVYELYYAWEVFPWFTITPDIQVITNPGGMKDARDAIVGGVRFKVVF